MDLNIPKKTQKTSVLLFSHLYINFCGLTGAEGDSRMDKQTHHQPESTVALKALDLLLGLFPCCSGERTNCA